MTMCSTTATRDLRTALLGFTALWLSACEAHALTATLGRSATAGRSADIASEAAGGDAPAPSLREHCPAGLTADSCHPRTVLVGQSVENARQRARAAGFTGQIDVAHLDEHDAACKGGTVCSVTPERWEASPGEPMTLWLNRKVTITAPE